MTPLVKAESVSRCFGTDTARVMALRPASFVIEPGERIALSGPSGSGKSTLLNLLAGIDDPSSGAIAWPGIGARDALRPLSVGLIYQFSALVPTLTIAENVGLPLRLGHCGGEAESRALEALARMHLSDFANRLPDELSGGQAQRAGIARVLAHRPKLILADEPTGQLDHAMGQEVLGIILEHAAQNGAAVVVATHDGSVANRMDRTWRIAHGQLDLGTEIKTLELCARAM